MPDFSFHPIQRSDFPMLSRWLTTPHVARWWADDPALDALERDYGGVIDGKEPCEVFIAHLDHEPIGLIQRLRWDDYPDYIQELAPIMRVPEHAYSIDYLLGPSNSLGKGLAAKMIRDFVADIWTIVPLPSSVIVPVNAANVASWHALERAGFDRVARGDLKPDNPVDDSVHYIYQTDRPQAL